MSQDRRVIVAAGVGVAVLLLGVFWLRPAFRWYSCQGGGGFRALVRAATMGAPSDLECLAVALDEREVEPVTFDEPTSDDGETGDYEPPDRTTTTLDPAVVAEQERLEAERQRAEEERQARVDACWAAYDREWAAWDAAYNAWSTQAWADYDAAWAAWSDGHDAEGNAPGPEPAQPDDAAWRAAHPEPVANCGS